MKVLIGDLTFVYQNDPIAFSKNPVIEKVFEDEIRKITNWENWLDKWIIVVDKKGRETEMRLIKRKDGRLHLKVRNQRSINYHASIYIHAVKKLIEEDKEIIDQSVIINKPRI